MKNTTQNNEVTTTIPKPPPRRTFLLSVAGLVGALLTGCGLSSAAAPPTNNGGGTNGKGKRMSDSAVLSAAKITDGQPGNFTVPPGKEVATLAAGCFWCVEAIFTELKGVEKVTSGYSGGNVDRPSYEEVCTGTTGHAEAVNILFDPKVISFSDLLHIFFTTHDPTTLNRQGADHGTQYRSAIFYHSPAQKEAAIKVMKEVTAEKVWPNPLVTEVTPFKNWYVAEDYHQNYYAQNGNQGYCRVVIEPKVRKFREKYRALLKK